MRNVIVFKFSIAHFTDYCWIIDYRLFIEYVRHYVRKGLAARRVGEWPSQGLVLDLCVPSILIFSMRFEPP